MSKILFTKEQIQKRVGELAAQIARDYDGKPLILVSVLKGSFIFASDLLRAMYEQGKSDVIIDFLTVASYGVRTQSSKAPRIVCDLTIDIQEKHVLLIDDIFDTGHTLKFVQEHLLQKQPASLKTLVLLEKPARREVEVKIDYVGFTLEGSPWVEGYGLDSAELGRGRPDIVVK